MTYDGTEMTQLPDSWAQDGESGWGLHTVFYYLEAPGAATGDVTIDSPFRSAGGSIVAYSLGDVALGDVETPAVNILESGESELSTEISSSAGHLLIDMIATDDADGHTARPGQTVVWDQAGDKSQSSSWKIAEDGVNTMGWDFTQANEGEGAQSVISIDPEPASMALLGLGGLALLKRKRNA